MGAMRSAARAGRFFLGFSEGAELRILGCSTLSRFKFNVQYTTLPLPAPNPLLTNPAKGFTPSLQHQSFCFWLSGKPPTEIELARPLTELQRFALIFYLERFFGRQALPDLSQAPFEPLFLTRLRCTGQQGVIDGVLLVCRTL